MVLTDNPDGEVTIDFSFKFSKWSKDRLVKVIFCDGADEFVLEGDKKVERDGNCVTILDVNAYCKGNRIRLCKEQSRKFWDFLQMNGFLISWRRGQVNE